MQFAVCNGKGMEENFQQDDWGRHVKKSKMNDKEIHHPDRHQEQEDERMMASRLVHSVQLNALNKYWMGESQSLLRRELEAKEKELKRTFDEKSRELLERVVTLEDKVKDGFPLRSTTFDQVMILETCCDELKTKLEREEKENQAKLNQLVLDLTAQNKKHLELVVESYQRQIADLKAVHKGVTKEMEESFISDRINWEREVERTVEHELSTVNDKIEERLHELEISQGEREHMLIDEYTQQINELKEELERRGEVFDKRKDKLKGDIVELQGAMAELVREREELIKDHQKEKEEMITQHQNELDKITSDFASQLHTATQMTAQIHMQDQNILHSLQQQLLKVKQDRDTLHGAVTQLHDSLMSLVLSFVPPPSLLPPVSNEENASAIGNKQLTTPSSITPITNWAQLSVPKTASNLATPTSPTHMTISRDDSGLASHQTSTDRMTSQKIVMTQDRPKPDLSISYINDGDTTIPDHLHPDNLTIYSLNSSLTDDNDDDTPPTTMQVLSMLHLSVINLVEKFLTSTTQASRYQNDLVNVQSQLSQNEVDLSDRLSHVERLQRELDILKQELEEHRGNEKVAQEKIASLISEVEVLQNANDKDELVNETEELLKEYKELESINNGLDSKCSEQEKIIEDKDNTISDVIQQVKVLEKKLQVSQSDCNALQNDNHNLQLKMETCQVQHRQEVELLRSENSKLVKKLDVSNNRIHELEDLPAQLLMKEKTMEELQDTIKDLSCQLRDALHQVAINEAAPTLREQLVKLQEQVSQHKAKYNDLLKIYEEGVASLTSANEEIEKGKEVQATLESRMKHHDGEVKQKNKELQKLKEEIDGDRATLNDQITLLTESVDVLTEQLELSNEHVTKLCLQLEEKEVLVCQLREEHSAIHGEVQGLRDETQTHLMAYQQSVVELQKLQDEVKQLKQLVEDKEMEINTLTITKGHTNERLNHLEKEIIDKEEQHQLQVLSLQEQVKSAGLDLRESQDGLKQLKDTHEQELRELEERLQAEYAGQESLLKLQLKELSETQVNINTQVLQQIADVTPLMERDALELLKICKRNNKDQAKSVEMIKSLTDANKSLQDQFVIAQNTLKDLEKSMTLANATLLRLQKELESSTERETKCQEQISKLKAVIEEKEMNEDSNVNEEDLERLRQELSGAHLEAKQANEGLEESMARVQVLLKELADSNDNTRQLEGLLKKERVKVASLKSLLDDKMLTNGEGLIYSDHLQKSPVASKKRASIDKQQHQLKSLLHKTEVKCKALVFQKRYLQSELDAYYHTNQAALMMIQDMGGVAWQPFPRRCSATNPKRRFKIYAITVIASIRLKRCYHNNNHHK